MALVLALGVTSASADTLVDRGLPTDNLNNTAGALRSNVAWTEGGYTSALYWLDGDTFKNTSSQTWSIDKIRMWTVSETTTATLWGGIEGGGSIGVASSAGVISAATYADSSTYQGYSGAYRSMNQVDFSVNIQLAAGQTYDFFLDGTGGQYVVPFAHASNSALSGSTQQGADGALLWGEIANGSYVGGGTWSSSNGNGWDKGSDLNVQVFGSAIAPVPEPETYAMMLAGLGLLGVVARRRKQKSVA
jgi:hypothetical protein